MLCTIQNSLQVPLQSLSAATTDEEIDAYLSGDDVSNTALFDHYFHQIYRRGYVPLQVFYFS
jgi:hypothetical protein